MNKIFLCILLTTPVSNLSNAQTPEWAWGRHGGGGAADFAYGTAFDASGNIYYCGNFGSGTATFGSVNLTSAGLGDGFLCKYDKNGNFQWVKQISGTKNEQCTKVAVTTSGDIYVTGFSEGDFSADGNNYTSLGEDDGFVAKYNNNGVLQWLNHFGGQGEDYPYNLAIDATGKCVIIGSFEHSLSVGGITLTAQNDSLYDCFVVKFNKQGGVIWATSAGGTGSHAYIFASDLVIDNDGSIYVTGTYTGPVLIGTDSLGENEEAFLTKLSSNGVFQWAVDAGSRCYYSYIGLDEAKNIYVTGSFGAYGFHSVIGPFTLIPNGQYMDIYLAKFNNDGEAQWVQTGGSELNDFAGGLAVDSAGNAWICGYILGESASFGSNTLNSSGKEDVFITSYNFSGNVNWLMKAGAKNVDRANDLAFDGTHSLAIAGSFKKKIKFGGITLTAPSSSADAWLGKISTDGLRLENVTEQSLSVEVYPNPAEKFLTIKSLSDGTYDVQIFSEDGKLEINSSLMIQGANEKRLDISSLQSGIYILRLTSREKKFIIKFLKE